MLRSASLALLLILAMPAVVPATRAAEASDLKITATLDFASKYLWRGLVYNDDAVLKPSLSLGYQDFQLTILGIFDSNDYWGREDNFEEVDYDLSYRHAMTDTMTLTGGAIYYYYPGQSAPADAVVYVRGAYDLLLQPQWTVYYDFRNAHGFYVTLAASHEIPLDAVHDKLALILDGTLGWGSSDWNETTFPIKLNDNAMVNLSPGATLRYRASEQLSFAWYARYDYLLDSEIRDHAKALGVDSSNFSFGAQIAYTF